MGLEPSLGCLDLLQRKKNINKPYHNIMCIYIYIYIYSHTIFPEWIPRSVVDIPDVFTKSSTPGIGKTLTMCIGWGQLKIRKSPKELTD
jgi:hypothetical protein